MDRAAEAFDRGHKAGLAGEAISKHKVYLASLDNRSREAFYRGYLQGTKEAR